MKNRSFVNVIGCGFAGCECALSLAEKGVKVHVFDDRDITHRPNEEAVEFACKKQFAEKLLKQELSFLGSNIIKIEKELASQGIYDSQILLEKARERVKNHPNIRFFNITVKELNFDEINVVATGPQTNKDFFEHLVQTFGSRKCFDCFPVFAMVENVQEKFFCHKGENLYLPLSYQEYIDFVNTIVLKLNFEILAQGKLPAKDTVEYMAMKDKDLLRNEYMRPVFLENCSQKPYAVLKLEKIGQSYQISGFSSQRSPEAQRAILISLKGFDSCRLVRPGQTKQNCYINAPYMINEFCQSEKLSNLFFAGNIAGVFGQTESIASGLYVANNVFRLFGEKMFVKLPKKTCLGFMMQKIIKTNNFNYSKFEPIFADYDIIEDEKQFANQFEKEKFLILRSKFLLEKYKEELKNGKYV